MNRNRLLALTTGLLIVAACDGSDGATSATAPLTTTMETATTNDPTTTAAGDPTATGRLTIRPVERGCGTVELTTGDTVPPAPSAAESGWLPLRGTDQWCEVGPVGADGSIFRMGADAEILDSGGWGVIATFRDGGVDVFNRLAAACFQKDATCPAGQLAMVVDDEIVSAPQVMTPEFAGTLQISGAFTESEARQLAVVINVGALPG